MKPITEENTTKLSELHQKILWMHVHRTIDLNIVCIEMSKLRSQPPGETNYDVEKLKTIVETARAFLENTIEGITEITDYMRNCQMRYLDGLIEAKTPEARQPLLDWYRETNPVLREASTAAHCTISTLHGFHQQYIFFQRGINDYERKSQSKTQPAITKNELEERDDLPRV